MIICGCFSFVPLHGGRWAPEQIWASMKRESWKHAFITHTHTHTLEVTSAKPYRLARRLRNCTAAGGVVQNALASAWLYICGC